MRVSFEERLGLLADRELTEREDRRLRTRLKKAKLRLTASGRLYLTMDEYHAWRGDGGHLLALGHLQEASGQRVVGLKVGGRLSTSPTTWVAELLPHHGQHVKR